MKLESPINPSHYRTHPSGIECIQITEHMSFNLGNVVKYVWRVHFGEGFSREQAVVDLQKAKWYLQRELNKLLEEEKAWVDEGSQRLGQPPVQKESP